MAAATEEGEVSAWSPFRYRVFAVLWIAMLLSNVGGWMHDVGAGWLMTTLNPSPLLVSLVQAATTLPVFLLALPAGALADIVDRRRLLLIAKIYMTVIAAAMGMVVLAGRMTPEGLLLFTVALGAGTALINPAWQAIVPQLVPRQQLASAVALNSVGINVSRAIGPALAGVAIATLGLASPFLLNAVSFLAVIGALLWWRPPAPARRQLPAERWVAAMRAGLRYARSSGPLKGTLLRAIGFLLFASAYWALLPLIAREQLDGNAELYGVLVTCIGAGAVAGATMLPRLRKRYGASRLVLFSSVGTAAVLVAFALLREPAFVAGACVLAGATWIAALSSFNVSAQMSLPGLGSRARPRDFQRRAVRLSGARQHAMGTDGRRARYSERAVDRGGRRALHRRVDGTRAAAIRRRLGSDACRSLAATGRHGIDRTGSRADHGHGGVSRRSIARGRFPGGLDCSRASAPA